MCRVNFFILFHLITPCQEDFLPSPGLWQIWAGPSPSGRLPCPPGTWPRQSCRPCLSSPYLESASPCTCTAALCCTAPQLALKKGKVYLHPYSMKGFSTNLQKEVHPQWGASQSGRQAYWSHHQQPSPPPLPPLPPLVLHVVPLAFALLEVPSACCLCRRRLVILHISLTTCASLPIQLLQSPVLLFLLPAFCILVLRSRTLKQFHPQFPLLIILKTLHDRQISHNIKCEMGINYTWSLYFSFIFFIFPFFPLTWSNFLVSCSIVHAGAEKKIVYSVTT